MPHRIVIAHRRLQDGEDYGLFVQHVETMRWLFEDDPAWEIVPLDTWHPAFPDAALAADILIVTMMPAQEIETAVRLRRARGLRTVFEISDNILALGGWLGDHHLLHSPLVRQSILFHAWHCDALQVYTPALARLFKHVNRTIAVLDPYVPIAPPPGKPSGFVVGWGGTSSHRGDLAAIAPVVERFCARHGDAVFAFMGNRALFDELFSTIPPPQVRYRPFGPFDEYLDFVRGLHVGLAPLAPSPFNAARTDTKFTTFAAAGTAALLQDAAAFRPHAERARLFSSPEDLERQLDDLYADRTALRDLTVSAYEWVRAHRGRDALRAQRDRLYRSLLPDRAAEPRAAGTDPRADGDVARLTAAAAAAPAETLTACRELLRARPGYAQAQWLLLRTLEASGREAEALAFAASIAPHPLYADLVAELQARHDPQFAGRVASPLRRARLGAKQATDKLAFYRGVLEHHPYDFFALSAVIRLLSRTEPDSPDLDDLYARAALVAPESVPLDRRPADLAGFLPS